MGKLPQNFMTGLYRSLGLREFDCARISGQSAFEGGKVVSPTHRPPLPLGNILGPHFCCGPGSSVGIATELRAGLSGD